MTPTVLLRDKSRVEKFLVRERRQLSSYSFVNIFGWSDFFDFEFEEIHNRLCIYASHDVGCFLYLPPLGGPLEMRVVTRCFDRMDTLNKKSGVSRIENVTEDQLKFFSSADFKFFPKAYEYCYYKKDLIGLKGNTFKSKRSDLNYFVNHYSAEFKTYQSDMLEDCLKLYEQWMHAKLASSDDEVYREMLKDNQRVHALVLKNFQKLGLQGRAVMIGQKLEAYSFGYPLNDGIFCILFEVTNFKKKGLPVFIFNQFCADPVLKNFKFINVMDDFGMDNIARAKESFRPSVLLPSYVVVRKGKSQQ